MDEFETFERDGFTIKARTEYDDDSTPPWKRADGHGPVSEWTTRNKGPGERVLCSDRSAKRYYDFAEAIEIAKRDGWGWRADEETGEPLTKGQRAAKAVESDFKFLQSWCNDQWHYVGVILSVEKNGVELDRNAASLWGVENNDSEYLREVAEEMVDEAVAVGRATMAKLNEDCPDCGKPLTLTCEDCR